MKKILIALMLGIPMLSVAGEGVSYYTTNRGGGGYLMNSYGSYYGWMGNKVAGSDTWCLGYSADMFGSTGTCVLTWTTAGISGTLTGNAATASSLATAGSSAASGYLCRGIDASGNCLSAIVDSAAVSSSTSPVQSGGMYTALAGKLPIDGSSAMTGGFRPYPRTTAQLAVSTPSVVGQQVFNTDIKAYCQGNGTTNAGDWKLVSSTNTACQ
jgi:hypothetical protein